MLKQIFLILVWTVVRNGTHNFKLNEIDQSIIVELEKGLEIFKRQIGFLISKQTSFLFEVLVILEFGIDVYMEATCGVAKRLCP